LQEAKEEANRAKAARIANCFKVLFFIEKRFRICYEIGFPKTFLLNVE